MCRSSFRTNVLSSLLLVAICTAGSPGFAAFDGEPNDSVNVESAHHLSVPASSSPIEIDGRLDETSWNGAARATGFVEVQPGENVDPSVETVAYLTYDDTRLYVGFRADEPDPSSLRASVGGRDEIFRDDIVGIYLDTYGNAAWAYGLFVNPLGIQADVRKTSDREDTGFDLNFRSAGRITERGYEVEMAIPFHQLRYPERPVHTWNVLLMRAQPREKRRILSWTPYRRDDPCLLCQMGTIGGLTDLNARPRTRIIPAAVGSQRASRTDRGLEAERISAEPSITLNHPVGEASRIQATVNPDFSHVESDPARLDVNTTFALSYPERRPFFQEGADLLDTPLNTLHTRSLNEPMGAVKLTRRTRRSGHLVLAARDERTPLLVPLEERSRVLEAGVSHSSILRWRRDVGRGSYLGTTLAGRYLQDGGAGGVSAGIDGQKRFGQAYSLSWHGALSHTSEPVDSTLSAPIDGHRFGAGRYTSGFDGESFTGHAGHLRAERESRSWDTEVSYRAVSGTFRAPLGFVNRNAFRELRLHQAAIRYPTPAFVDELRPYVDGGRSWNFDGGWKKQWVESGIVVRTSGQSFVRLDVEHVDERFRDRTFRGMNRVQLFANARPTRGVEIGMGGSYGGMIARSSTVPARGLGYDVAGRTELRLGRRLRASLQVRFSRLRTAESGEQIFSGLIGRSRWEYRITRDLSVRTILDYDGFDGVHRIEPLLQYEPAPFTRIYVGSSHGIGSGRPDRLTPLHRVSRDLFFKVQYAFEL